MILPEWVFSPTLWIAFWTTVGMLVLFVLYASIGATQRQLEENEAELEAGPFNVEHVGSNVWIIMPDFHDDGDDAA